MVKVQLTTNKTKHSLELDGSNLDVERAVLYSKRFEELYLGQLEELFVKTAKSGTYNFLIELLLIVEYVKDGKVPVGITSNKSKGDVRRIIPVLKKFIEDNFEELSTLHKNYVDALVY